MEQRMNEKAMPYICRMYIRSIAAVAFDSPPLEETVEFGAAYLDSLFLSDRGEE